MVVSYDGKHKWLMKFNDGLLGNLDVKNEEDEKPEEKTFNKVVENERVEDSKPASLEDFKVLLERSTDELIDKIKHDFASCWSEESLQRA